MLSALCSMRQNICSRWQCSNASKFHRTNVPMIQAQALIRYSSTMNYVLIQIRANKNLKFHTVNIPFPPYSPLTLENDLPEYPR